MTHQQTDIIESVRKNQIDKVEQELKAGLNVNTQDKNQQSLLLIATKQQNYQMAELLVKNGADVNLQDNILDSPFLYAGAAGLTNFLELFLQHGTRFDVFNRYNGSALIPACERGHIETVRLLANTKGFPIDHVNRLGWTGLLEAVILGDGSQKYVEIVRILIDAGSDINIPDKNGVTALQHAQSAGYKNIAEVLKKSKNR
ncbi:ankyrin repeat domain-containing protein [Pseudopedobacter beijingensis]|uniref:Ankyrin repeat domain-containing protein n=1 Tax=Pseudopedobacter beijingensis TaxID=1207056 RepID=A0ABW4I8R3_9SPHI